MRKLGYFVLSTIHLWIFALVLIILYLIGYGYLFTIELIGIMMLISLPLTFPGLIMFFNHLRNDKLTAKIELLDDRYIFIGKEKKIIKKIVLIERRIENEGNFPALPWQNFYFFEVITESQSYFLSCLSFSKKNIQYNVFINKKFPSIVVKTPKSIIENESIENNRLIKKYSKKSTEELNRVINNQEQYSETAMQAAKYIIENRS